jgi:hypothetical protein
MFPILSSTFQSSNLTGMLINLEEFVGGFFFVMKSGKLVK